MLLEILPILDEHDLKPIFVIRTRNYGLLENDYNIFPHIIELNYEPKKILYSEIIRSVNSDSIHLDNGYDKTMKSDSAVINSYSLSKCDYVLSTNSAMSSWAKIFNPSLNIRRLQDFPQDWFPVAYIPMYDESNN